MGTVMLLTNAPGPSLNVLPALGLLPHAVRVVPAQPAALVHAPDADVVLLDARRDLLRARDLAGVIKTTGLSCPLLLIVTEGGLAGLHADWGADDFLLDTAGPAEVDARLRLAGGRTDADSADEHVVRHGELTIEEETYTAKLRGRVLDLTYIEFELLKYLAQHPGRVFTRGQLLQEVWGYDYFGGVRTVDVHIRRLRAKLGAEHEVLIGTVRGVGYRFQPAQPPGRAPSSVAGDC